jgi:CheY-like chemotaxis protein
MARILLVDDDANVRSVFARMLRQVGFDIVEAPDGLEAIRCLHASDFDAVVTDNLMPRMGGLELLSLARNEFPHLPFVVMSGTQLATDIATMGTSEQPDSSVMLPKPFRFAELRRAIDAVLPPDRREAHVEKDDLNRRREGPEGLPNMAVISRGNAWTGSQSLQGGSGAL